MPFSNGSKTPLVVILEKILYFLENKKSYWTITHNSHLTKFYLQLALVVKYICTNYFFAKMFKHTGPSMISLSEIFFGEEISTFRSLTSTVHGPSGMGTN